MVKLLPLQMRDMIHTPEEIWKLINLSITLEEILATFSQVIMLKEISILLDMMEISSELEKHQVMGDMAERIQIRCTRESKIGMLNPKTVIKDNKLALSKLDQDLTLSMIDTQNT